MAAQDVAISLDRSDSGKFEVAAEGRLDGG
jgi:hypothetical protein